MDSEWTYLDEVRRRDLDRDVGKYLPQTRVSWDGRRAIWRDARQFYLRAVTKRTRRRDYLVCGHILTGLDAGRTLKKQRPCAECPGRYDATLAELTALNERRAAVQSASTLSEVDAQADAARKRSLALRYEEWEREEQEQEQEQAEWCAANGYAGSDAVADWALRYEMAQRDNGCPDERVLGAVVTDGSESDLSHALLMRPPHYWRVWRNAPDGTRSLHTACGEGLTREWPIPDEQRFVTCPSCIEHIQMDYRSQHAA